MSDNKTCSTKKNQIVKLGDILEVLIDYHSNGSYKTLKENVTLLEQPNFAIMIRTTNFEKNDFRKNLIYINQQAYNFLSKSKVLHQDILINKIANSGAVYFMPRLDKPVSLGMNLFLLRIKKDYNKYFIFCILKHNEKRLRLMAKGTTTKTITKDNIKMFQILLPPLETQQKIARTLSILDQKIENNHKINELLHKILELLYEQYFVRFDFLDENNKPYQTSGGKMKFSKELNRLIPNDFEVKTLGELTQLKVGNKNANHSSNQGKYPFFTCSNNPLRCETYQFEGKHIIISGNGNFYVTHYDGKFDAYQRTYVVNPNNPNHYVLIYLFVKSYTNYLKLQSRGSIIKFITKSDIENIKIVLPNLKTYAKLNNVLKMIENNNQSTQTLTALRDFLLPLLLKQQVKPE
ncbi:restriction endonuclease subunit S [Helicobacter pylori]|uniref:restriction endonuclease subunit S n=1 Tax=Helicobacter pylori TaxID=210 RepID=UPI001FCFC29A|nr:restriction endonuclease subunit S [Helicobacter pylori]UOS48976.1 restriction endonuclease subunit S [Helicobacter pylori]